MTNGAVVPKDPYAGVPGIARLRELVASLDSSDPSRRDHSQRVAYYSVLIAVRLHTQPATVPPLMLAAQLHDVGCVAVPERVLDSAAPFGDELRALVEPHVLEGQRALTNLGLVQEANWVRHHHERWDGRGYPDGLAGVSIPLESRIIAGAETTAGVARGAALPTGADRVAGGKPAGGGSGGQPRPGGRARRGCASKRGGLVRQGGGHRLSVRDDGRRWLRRSFSWGSRIPDLSAAVREHLDLARCESPA